MTTPNVTNETPNSIVDAQAERKALIQRLREGKTEGQSRQDLDRRVRFLAQWIHMELVAACRKIPSTVGEASRELDELGGKMTDLRDQIAAAFDHEDLERELVEKRKWLSRRASVLKAWVAEQKLLPPEHVVAGAVTPPVNIYSARIERREINHMMSSLRSRFEELRVLEQPEERIALLKQMHACRERLQFLGNWQETQERLKAEKKQKAATQRKKLLDEMKGPAAQSKVLLEEQYTTRLIALNNEPPPASLQEAKKERAVAVEQLMSADQKLQVLKARDKGRDALVIERRILEHQIVRLNQFIASAAMQEAVPAPQRISVEAQAAAQPPQPAPASLTEAKKERHDLRAQLRAAVDSDSERAAISRRLALVMRWIAREENRLEDEGADSMAAVDLSSPDDVDSAINAMLARLNKDLGHIIYTRPSWLAVWNAFRARLSLRELQAHCVDQSSDVSSK